MAEPFRVIAGSFARAQFHALARSFIYQGRPVELTRAMRQIGQLLTHSPRTVGNPMYCLRAAKLDVFNMTHGSLYVEYGVHDTEALVVIRSVSSFRGQVE